MRFQDLYIQRFRNLADVSISLSPGLNLFVGPNGAGKTALLEAVHLLARGRSFRTTKLSQILQHGQTDLLVRANIQDAADTPLFHAGMLKKRGTTELKVDGQKQARLSDLAKRVPLQLMLPGVSDLIFGGPAGRRQFLHWGVFHVKHDYSAAWQGYARALRQRNTLLKAAPDIRSAHSADLSVWTDQLVSYAAHVHALQLDYLSAWLPSFQATLQAISVEVELDFEYDAGHADLRNATDYPSVLTKLMSENLPREVKYGTTLVGPHRADLSLLVNGKPAGGVLSRGQGKAVALALLVSQAQHLMEINQQTSAFLIDDVGAELDGVHNRRFYTLLNQMGCQILATCTDLPPLGGDFPIE